MKFPKPRILTKNEYPDLKTPQPDLFKELINEIIYPEEGSARERYLQQTIDDLKERSKKKNKAIKLNQLFINRRLYYINICIQPRGEKDGTNIHALVETGAANSLIHLDVVRRLKLEYEPCKMIICTATGTDSESIKGIAHLKFRMKSTRNMILETCTNFIVTDKLNGMDCILGADFLMHSSKVSRVSSNSIVWKSRGKTHRVRVADESQVNSLGSINTYIKRYDPKNLVRQDLECIECTEGITSTRIKANTIQITDLMGETVVMGSDMEEVKTNFEQNRMDSRKDDITEASEYLGKVWINSHSVHTEYIDETLPESTEMFEDSQELKEEVLT